MQSTGQTSTPALSLTSMHGSTITYVIAFLPCTEQVRRPLGSYVLPVHRSKSGSGLKGYPGIRLAFSSGLDLASSQGASGLRGVDQVEWSGGNGRCALRNCADAFKYARESR